MMRFKVRIRTSKGDMLINGLPLSFSLEQTDRRKTETHTHREREREKSQDNVKSKR